MSETGEGLVALDQKGRVQSVNQITEQLLGWSAEELRGTDFFAHCGFSLEDSSVVTGGSQCPALVTVNCPHLNDAGRLAHKDGRLVRVSFMLSPITEGEKVVGKLFLFRDLGAEEEQADIHAPSALLDKLASIVVSLDASGKVCFSNHQARCLSAEISVTNLLPESIPSMLLESPHLLDQQTLLDRRMVDAYEKELCIAWSVAVLRDAEGGVNGAVCVGNDFTDHNHSFKSQLHASRMMLEVYDHINDAVLAVDQECRITYMNMVAEQLTGWDIAEVWGAPVSDVYQVLDENGRQRVADPISICFRSRRSVRNQDTRVLLRRDGRDLLVADSATPLFDADGSISGAVMIFADISELRGIERRLEYEVSHDSLTGLINRRQFVARLQQVLDQDADGQHALLHIDLDQFRLINDGYGYDVGDNLLKELSVLLLAQLAEGDSLARLDGDEFGIILENYTLERAKRKAKHLCSSIRDYSFFWQGKPIHIGASIGLVALHEQDQELPQILRMADSACYVAKQQGRNRVHVYQDQDFTLTRRDGEVRWTQRIRDALRENRFRLYCQNIVPLGEVDSLGAHYEILLRMIDEEGKVLRPAAFISAAERYHLMPTIDRWVISSAIKLLGERRARGESNGVFSINISGQSLDDEEFLGFVVDQFHQGNVPPETICFEITETTAASSLMVVQRFIAVLRGMGCRFALDDFGRGISSFAYLKNLDVDYLKIDGMFVRDLATDKVGHAMVESINNIGHLMGVQTIAEFVESNEVLEKLVDMGVDHVQGYQLGQPRPLMPIFQSVDSRH